MWKYHNVTPCIDILNKCLFSKMENRRVKQVLSGCWHQWEGEGHEERV
jgi:chitinase